LKHGNTTAQTYYSTIQQCKNLYYTRPTITIVSIVIIFVILTLSWNLGHLASQAGLAGQHGTNPGHPGKFGMGGNPTYIIQRFCLERILLAAMAWLAIPAVAEFLYSLCCQCCGRDAVMCYVSTMQVPYKFVTMESNQYRKLNITSGQRILTKSRTACHAISEHW